MQLIFWFICCTCTSYSYGLRQVKENLTKTNVTSCEFLKFLTKKDQTRSSADAEELHDVPQIQNITPKKVYSREREMTFKDIQGHHNCSY